MEDSLVAVRTTALHSWRHSGVSRVRAVDASTGPATRFGRRSAGSVTRKSGRVRIRTQVVMQGPDAPAPCAHLRRSSATCCVAS